MTISVSAALIIAAVLLAAVCLGRALDAFVRFLDSAPADEACAAVATALGFSGLAGALAGGCFVMIGMLRGML